MKVGDLVRFKRVHPFKKLGIVVGITWDNPMRSGRYPAANIMWMDEDNPQGAGWAFVYALEVISESR